MNKKIPREDTFIKIRSFEDDWKVHERILVVDAGSGNVEKSSEV